MGGGGERVGESIRVRRARGSRGRCAYRGRRRGRHAGGAWTHFAIVPLTTWSRIILMGSMVPDGALSSPRKADETGFRRGDAWRVDRPCTALDSRPFHGARCFERASPECVFPRDRRRARTRPARADRSALPARASPPFPHRSHIRPLHMKMPSFWSTGTKFWSPFERLDSRLIYNAAIRPVIASLTEVYHTSIATVDPASSPPASRARTASPPFRRS